MDRLGVRRFYVPLTPPSYGNVTGPPAVAYWWRGERSGGVLQLP